MSVCEDDPRLDPDVPDVLEEDPGRVRGRRQEGLDAGEDVRHRGRHHRQDLRHQSRQTGWTRSQNLVKITFFIQTDFRITFLKISMSH